MRTRLTDDIKQAMRSGDKKRLGTLRLIQAAIKDRDLNIGMDSKGQPSGMDRISDADILSLLQKMIKQRRESIATYAGAGRTDLVEQEEAEIVVIEDYLPRQMDGSEIETAVASVIGEIGAIGLKDMGRTMAVLKERFTGRMDFAKASAMLKERLK
ncbi:MAG: GatB/YqeY domain-containing protein [Hyphomicrobium sp.]|nr:GatB/YqeY domain-containing protein [Hyphomicrobium sp.]